jgi:hypothetical protein
MPTSARHNKNAIASRPIAGQRDLVRVAPRRATWGCRCGYTNVIDFGRQITVGHVFPERMKCSGCSLEYRGRFITAPTTERSLDLFDTV